MRYRVEFRYGLGAWSPMLTTFASGAMAHAMADAWAVRGYEARVREVRP